MFSARDWDTMYMLKDCYDVEKYPEFAMFPESRRMLLHFVFLATMCMENSVYGYITQQTRDKANLSDYVHKALLPGFTALLEGNVLNPSSNTEARTAFGVTEFVHDMRTTYARFGCIVNESAAIPEDAGAYSTRPDPPMGYILP